jgi:hypothetical protein
MVVGNYLRASINIEELISYPSRIVRWVEDARKLFIFQKRSCLNSSLALDAAKKRFEWTSFERKTALASVAVAVDSKQNSPSSMRRAKSMFIVCSLTKSTARRPERHP